MQGTKTRKGPVGENCENPSPPHLKWADSVESLLLDPDGVNLFKQFLEQEECSNLLDFYFACSGIKNVPNNDETKMKSIVKLIARRYLKGESGGLLSCIGADVKKNIIDRIRKKDYDSNIFDAAHSQVEEYIYGNLYQTFLNSEVYLSYNQQNRASSHSNSSGSSSGSHSVRPLSTLLPTVHEDEELRIEEIVEDVAPAAPLTSQNLLATRHSRLHDFSRQTSYDTSFPSRVQPPNPYHVSAYLPVSAQDSERASASSDALTDDTRSLTDSSVDHGGQMSRRRLLRHQQFMARHNREASSLPDPHAFMPRTQRPRTSDQNLAEVDPEKFAELICEKLQRLAAKRERTERLQMSLRQAGEGESCTDVSLHSNTVNGALLSDNQGRHVSGRSSSGVSGGSSKMSDTLLALSARLDNLASTTAEDDESVLDAHISKWDSSVRRSPGRFSPRARSPEGRIQGSMAHYHAGVRSYSLTGSSMYRSYHRHSHKQRGRRSASQEGAEISLMDSHLEGHPVVHSRHSSSRHHNTSRSSRPSQHHSQLHTADQQFASSSADMLSQQHHHHQQFSNPGTGQGQQTDSAQKRVMEWMLQSDQMNSTSAATDSEKSSSHNRHDRRTRGANSTSTGGTSANKNMYRRLYVML